VIKLSAVSKSFKRHQVLKSLNLEITTGERIALLGSNGAGKTTLIRCLLGEYTFQGSITVNGLDPRHNRREVLAQIGFVPQLPPPLKMPVDQLINFAASVCGSSPADMVAVAEQLGLDIKLLQRHPFEKLSGGQKQKLLISIALGRPTALLIMDEPTANLDPEARKTVIALLQERANSCAMLISSHRVDEVANLVNRVVELDRGEVVADKIITPEYITDKL
jgi:ABC-2 type transport system ATP-binding protein